MIKIITLITKFSVATLIVLFFSSCKHSIDIGYGIDGSGNITTEKRTPSEDFKSIEVSNSIKVIVEQGDNKAIIVEADDNLQEHIITKVENGVLKIEADESYDATETPVVKVKMKKISGLKTSGGAEISSENVLITENIKLKSTSGSEIRIEVEADFIKMESESGSSIEANGKALKSETHSSSGSEINAQNLMTNEVVATSESGSSTSVYPILKLDAKASSGSSISYHKIPKTLSKEEKSGGSVEKE